MSSLALDPPAHSSSSAPTFIPPRSSSHGVAFSSPARNSASPEHQPVSPPRRKSSKRPVSNTSEGWLAQSSEKKALTAQGLAATKSARRHTHSHSHSHRTKSALERSDEAAWFAAPGLMHMAPSSRPPNDPPHDIGDVFIHAKNPPWSKEKEKVLLGPYDYLFGHPGKDIRAQLISAFNEWLRVPEESLTVITKVIGMLHTASLLYVSRLVCCPTDPRQG
jgi:geranylgeranyl diphosphate synthase type 3